MKFSGEAFNSRCASRISSVPLLSSSPIDSSPMRGRSMPSETFAYTAPIAPNCSRCVAPALDIGAHVEQDAESVARWDRRGERRTIDAGQHAERRVRRQHRRARMPRAHQRRRVCRRATDSAATRIDARGFRRRAAAGASRHADDVGRVENADAQLVGVGCLASSARIVAGRAGKQKPEIEMTRSSQGAVDDAAGGVVAAHRVYGDSNHEGEWL